MGLLEDIKKVATEIKKNNKRDSILKVSSEIKIMIDEKIPLKKQIELLTKNNIIDSIDLKYYREILKSNFGYSTAKKAIRKTTLAKQDTQTKTKEKSISVGQINTQKKTATEMLSQSIELKF